ncbi:MAG TPA: ribonuclease HII, partial [Sutterella sp.]|nr:ribonuclease HII [Sutterella sp.]
VFAAAVILDETRPIAGLADSKKLTPKARAALELEIKEKALTWCVASASVEEIDRFNILKATLLAMTRAVEGLKTTPEFVLVDGNRLPSWRYASRAVIKGDATVPAISAASVLAKEAHDRVFVEYEKQYPAYGFAEHKGYGTERHLEALRNFGPTPVHRKTFYPVSDFFAEKTDDLFSD